MNAPPGRDASGSPATTRRKPAPRRVDRPWRRSVGERIGDKYALVEPLGRGGMAEVWVARHEELRSLVAIKFLDRPNAAVVDPEVGERVLERFRFEAQISARLAGRTQHVVAVHDAGTHAQTPYLVMEHVPGYSLEALLDRSGAMEPAEVARMLDQLADALAAAHEIGIVHRDVKPSNVLLHEREEGVPWTAKLADFGVAKAFGADQELDRPRETEEGLLVGSPAYMSPEQIGTELEMDGRSDLWAIGVMVYEALTGWPPFSGHKLAELVVAITTKAPDPPSQIRATLGAGIDAWMKKALAKRPEDRFQTATDMAQAFHEALAPTAAVTGLVKRDRLLPAIGAAVVIAGVAVIAAVSLRGGGGASVAPSTSSTPSSTAQEAAAPQPPPVLPRETVAIPPPPGSPEPDEPPRESPDTQSTAAAANKPAVGSRPKPKASASPTATATATPRKEVNPSETF